MSPDGPHQRQDSCRDSRGQVGVFALSFSPVFAQHVLAHALLLARLDMFTTVSFLPLRCSDNS